MTAPCAHVHVKRGERAGNGAGVVGDVVVRLEFGSRPGSLLHVSH